MVQLYVVLRLVTVCIHVCGAVRPDVGLRQLAVFANEVAIDAVDVRDLQDVDRLQFPSGLPGSFDKLLGKGVDFSGVGR